MSAVLKKGEDVHNASQGLQNRAEKLQMRAQDLQKRQDVIHMYSVFNVPIQMLLKYYSLNIKDLEQTINSLRRQNFKDFEYIVIDGVSSDGTKNVILQNLDILKRHQQ